MLTGGPAAGYGVDWTGRFRGQPAAVLRPRDTEQVAAVLALCTAAGLPVVPQGGNTGLAGGGVPRHGEVLLSLARLGMLGPADPDAAQVTAGAGVTLQQVADAAPGLDLGVLIASRGSATVGGAVATNAGGLRVLRYGPMRAQLRGVEAVLADGTVLSHLAGLAKDNTGYDYPGLLAGSEGTLAVLTQARLRLVPRPTGLVTVLAGLAGVAEVHSLARRAVAGVPGLLSAEFFTGTAWTSWSAGPGWSRRWPAPRPPTCCWKRPARARWTTWPSWPGTGTPRWPSRPRTGPGCGLTGNASRRRPASSAPHSSWTWPCPPRTGPGWPPAWPGPWRPPTRPPR